jgi:hypothetical protein
MVGSVFAGPGGESSAGGGGEGLGDEGHADNK